MAVGSPVIGRLVPPRPCCNRSGSHFPFQPMSVLYRKLPELLLESVRHGSHRVCAHRPRSVCLPVVPHRPHREALAILSVRILVVLASEARARALVVEAVRVVAPRPAVNRTAPRVQVAERAEEPLPHSRGRTKKKQICGGTRRNTLRVFWARRRSE